MVRELQRGVLAQTRGVVRYRSEFDAVTPPQIAPTIPYRSGFRYDHG
jgi:hypothetical protein